MATARTAHPARLLVLIAAIGGLLAGVMGGPAQAANNNTIEQHWELLADTLTGQIGEKTLFIRRGDLPGGTTGFEPAPSATMEVVAKVTGAGNASSGYDIKVLTASGAEIASVPFRGSDSDFTLEKTTSPFAWSSTTRAISSLKIVPVGTLPGAIDLKKAYFKLRQSGTVKKTIGRVPLASKSLSITRDTFGDLPDLLTYNHVAGDFNPAPTVQLRVTATATLCTLKVALVNLGTGLPLSGSELSFTSLASKITGPLTLNHLNTGYKIQAKAEQTDCGTQSQSGPEPQSGEPGAAGDVLSADLILSQSTTDTKGLVRTVGWYPSITASTTVAQNSQKLGFQFNSPVMTVPNLISSKWLTMVKLSTGTGVGAHLAYASTGTNHTTSPLSSASSWVAVEAPIASLPSTVTTFDSKAALTGTGAAGVISGSLIRSALHLWDIAAPQIVGSLGLTNPEFSPQASPGSKDTTTCSVSLTDYSPVSWTIEIRAGSTGTGALQRSQTGSGLAPSYTWNGTNSSGNAPDGAYACILSAADDSGNAIPAPLPYRTIIIDRVAPTISGFQSSVPRISPTNGPPSSTTFSATISESVTWTVSIPPASGGVSVRTFTGSTTSIALVWDGRYTTGGLPVPDDDYRATLTAADPAGNTASAQDFITIDKTGPTIAQVNPSNVDFSPGVSIGSKDTTTYTTTLTDSWTPLMWKLEIKSGAVIHRTLNGSGTNVTATWDGKDETGTVVPDGVYSALLTATDAGNNVSSRPALTVRVDTVAPHLSDPTPGDHGNTAFGSSQPLILRITDTDGSGVDSGAVSMGLSGGATYSGATLSYDPISGWTKTPPFTLTPGADKTATATARDRAGNSTALAWGFRAIAYSIEGAASELRASGYNTGLDGATLGTKRWEFMPVLTVKDRDLDLNHGSRHPGWGVIKSDVDLSATRVSVRIAGAWQDLVGQQPYAGTSKRVYQDFIYLPSTGVAQTVHVEGISGGLPRLAVDLPTLVEEARLILDVPSVQSEVAGLCVDPSVGQGGCSSDPLRFYIHEGTAARVEELIETEHHETTEVYDLQLQHAIEHYDPVKLEVYKQTNDDTWLEYQPITPVGTVQCVTGIYTNNPCFLEGVAYPEGQFVVGEGQFAEICEITPFCTHLEASSYYESRYYRCVNHDTGRDRFILSGEGTPTERERENRRGCVQYYFVLRRVADLQNSSTWYYFEANWLSEWGHQDGPRDELGITWGAVDGTAREWRLDAPDEIFGVYWGNVYPRYSEAAEESFRTHGCRPEGFNQTSSTGTTGAISQMKFVSNYGFGTGDYNDPLKGWRQWREYPCAGERPYSYRAEAALIGAEVRLVGSHESPRKEAHLLVTMGHTKQSVDPWKVVWEVVLSACAATAPPPYNVYCTVAAFDFAAQREEDEAQSRQRVTTTQWYFPEEFTY